MEIDLAVEIEPAVLIEPVVEIELIHCCTAGSISPAGSINTAVTIKSLPVAGGRFQNLQPDDSDYKKVLKALHTKSVDAAIQSYIPSKVLNSRSPEINPSESSLSRKEILLQHYRQFCPRQMPTMQPDPHNTCQSLLF